MPEIKLKQCAHCGSTKLFHGACSWLVGNGKFEAVGFNVLCKGCGMQTKCCDTMEEAAEDWNRRAEPVRHANAIYIPNSKGYPSCSYCHEEMPFFLNFCPCCGARMDADHIADDSKKVGGDDNG